LLILFDQNLVSKSNINEAQLWMKRKGIDCLALGTFDTFQINIVDLGQVPDADINEIRRLIAEKVTVSA
jgi:RIO-like serine/threonine protein kinase